jgi:hypothetical protein
VEGNRTKLKRINIDNIIYMSVLIMFFTFSGVERFGKKTSATAIEVAATPNRTGRWRGFQAPPPARRPQFP